MVLLMALWSGRWKIAEKVTFVTIVLRNIKRASAVIKRATSGSRATGSRSLVYDAKYQIKHIIF